MYYNITTIKVVLLNTSRRELLMKFKMNKILRKIKKKLIKKVIFYDYYESEKFINYKLRLVNFINLKKNVEAHFISDNKHLKTAYKLERNILTIQLPKEYLYKVDYRAVIKLVINKQEMLITLDEELMNYKENIIFNNKHYGISVNKNITIINRYNEFKFNPGNVSFHISELHYDSMILTLDNTYPQITANTNIKFYAFSNNKVRELNTLYNRLSGELEIKDFSLFSIGLWQLFISIDNELFTLNNQELYTEDFKTFHHVVNIINKENGVYLLFNPHTINSKTISINKYKHNNCIEIQIDPIEKNKHIKYSILIEDSKQKERVSKPLLEKNGILHTNISFNELFESASKRRFFIECTGDMPIKYQFNLEETNLIGNGVHMSEEIESQLVDILFYKRKDKSLGLKVSKPRIQKMITKVEDFVLYGYVEKLENFIGCKSYLLIEERGSLESIKIPIERNFKVDLLQFNLVDLKSKSKSIMDIFILVENGSNEIIRKEKIKYKYSDYKKDNYYSHQVIKDNKMNQHHFLITTTPFDNIKIETFVISSEFILPKDPSKKEHNIWLVGERYNTAQDNGIVFFQWLLSNTNIDAYYVIESDALDYQKIKENPKVLVFGSKKHFEIAIKAKVLIGTHDLENILPYKPAKGFFNYEDTYKVLLQHGVLGRKNVEYHKKYYDQPFDLFIVSSDPEKYDVVMDKFGYENHEVAVTGLARFDTLIQTNKPKDILLMPTWRDWINTDEQFIDSEYYATYNSLIHNSYLLELLDKFNVNLNFYPHYRAQDYFNKDLPNLNKRIKFIEQGSRTVQELLIDHALLITDYSSVSFDFSLMNKPVIYYHFDVRRFFRRGILRTIEETFIGRIAYSEEEMIKEIKEQLESGFKNYNLDISKIIKYQDKCNNKRIYDAIESDLDNGE